MSKRPAKPSRPMKVHTGVEYLEEDSQFFHQDDIYFNRVTKQWECGVKLQAVAHWNAKQKRWEV